ncbi:hypothetical protein [Curtobacterium sp. MCBD17_019]|uniref:hypothetical protein n=1 Tax=Curtobacterium sp. MCBD17_019 TaxID=2175669 RepID=UPI000DA703DA|nr:hypothetical protein [Curtobacterium sp. MCBD17_019]PZE73854.1 hypothetical protein DEI82_12370 [Curtobacterium sp. MCBD17_019]
MPKTKQQVSAKPISPELHGRIDYGFTAANLFLPGALGLRPGARRLFRLFGLVQGGLNAVTDQPSAAIPAVPFAVHGAIEKNSGLLYVLLPLITGVLKDRRARRFWFLSGIALVVVYNLTDWISSSGAVYPPNTKVTPAKKAKAAKKRR